MVSDRTKQCRRLKNLFTALHLLALFGPFLYFVPYGYATGKPSQSFGMSLMVLTALIIWVVSMISEAKHRAGLHKTMMFALILGVLFCLENVRVFVVIMCLVNILDELVFVPLRANFAVKLISNKEIDARI